MKKNNLTILLLFLFFETLVHSQDYHWQFNDNQVVTTAGYEVNLSGATPEMFIPGKINKSINFNGNQTSIPHSESVSIGTNGNYSISFWINPSYIRDENNNEHFIANKRHGQQQFQVFIDRLNRLQFFIYSTTNQPLGVICNKKVPLNRWSHITITVSNKINDRFSKLLDSYNKEYEINRNNINDRRTKMINFASEIDAQNLMSELDDMSLDPSVSSLVKALKRGGIGKKRRPRR